MNTQYQEAWNQAIDIVRGQVSSFVFDTWYRELVPVDLADGTFIITCDKENILQALASGGMSDRLDDALRRVIDPSITTRYISEADARLYLSVQPARPAQPEEAPQPVYPGAQEDPEGQPHLEVLDGYRLQPDYTFDTFVIGKNNERCQAFCKAIADDISADLNCSKKINPLFIYGNSGLGKTHLLNAVAYQILQAQPQAKIKFTTCENFMNEYIASISSNQNAAFRNKYRNVDVLLIDDIQFLTGKEGTQEEFFHTFEALRNNNAQIIITSDKLPRDIPDLEERLVTRFEGGVLTDIQVPNLETRIAILRKKAEMEHTEVDNRVIEYIVNHVGENIRTLQGALQTVIVTARFSNQDITLELAEAVIKNKVSPQKQITPDAIITTVCEHYGMSRDKMMGTSRKKEILIPRQISMYLCRNLLAMSLPAIGKLFKKDHSTVSNAIDKVESGLQTDPLLQGDVRAIRGRLEA
jgi:chromosomal replication initiator protein